MSKKDLKPTEVDPVTFKIIQHRLTHINDESIEALKRVSGSTNTNEGHDLMFALYNDEGALMTGGMGFLHHYVGASRAVKHIINQFEDNIYPGDTFLLNDPYTAALHPPDVYIITPVFYESEIVAFAANFVHVTDIGSVDPGGFSPNSNSIYEEGFRTEGLKLIAQGDMRTDILETIKNMSRTPLMVELDIRSQIAANNVATDRITELVEKYGTETVKNVSDTLIEMSEQSLRERIKKLPNGQWQARQYIDSVAEDELLTVDLTLINEGDSLCFDFSGTSPQSEYGINATIWAALGGVIAPMLPLLCHDLVWNDGLLKPIDIEAPEESVVNATPPAPMSVATVSSIKRCNALSTAVLSKMLGSHTEFKDRATGVWNGAYVISTVHVDRGEYAEIHTITDSFAGAGGARSFDDGITLGGELSNLVSRWANVERAESEAPLRYLFRRTNTDSGGPGKYRGGLGHEFALVPTDENADISLISSMHGMAYPPSPGVFGGYPGCTLRGELLRGTDAHKLNDGVVLDIDDLSSTESEDIQWGIKGVDYNDVVHFTLPAAGGLGDPLHRDSERVLLDVDQGYVSPDVAEEIYGVIPDLSGEPITGDSIQDELRSHRIDDNVTPDLPSPSTETSSTEYQLGPQLDVVTDGVNKYFECVECQTILSQTDENIKDNLYKSEFRPGSIDKARSADNGIVMREFACPECGSLIDTEITHKDDSTLVDLIY